MAGDDRSQFFGPIDPQLHRGDEGLHHCQRYLCQYQLLTSATLQAGYDAAHTTINRSVLQFDTSSLIPTTEILGAALNLSVSSTSSMTTSSTTLDLYGLTRTWTTAATWNKYDGVNAWSAPGGDFSSTLAASASISQGATGTVTWYPTALVQGWVDGSTPNDGMIVKGHDETTGDMVQFSSSDAPSSTTWPTWTVAYIPRPGMDPIYPLAGAAGNGVNTANGNLVLHATDLAMRGVGLPLVVDRTYNRQCAGPAMPGATSLGADCWQLGTGQDVGLISFGTGSVAYTDGTGQEYVFHRTGLYSYSSPRGIDATMVEDGTVHYTLTFHASGEVDVFHGGGSLQSQTVRCTHFNGPVVEPDDSDQC